MEKLGTTRKNLDSMIYERLKSMIIERKLVPGEKIYHSNMKN